MPQVSCSCSSPERETREGGNIIKFCYYTILYILFQLENSERILTKRFMISLFFSQHPNIYCHQVSDAGQADCESKSLELDRFSFTSVLIYITTLSSPFNRNIFYLKWIKKYFNGKIVIHE